MGGAGGGAGYIGHESCIQARMNVRSNSGKIQLHYIIQCFSTSTRIIDDDEFRFNNASTHEGHLRQNV